MLLVDDERTVRDVAADMLKAMGYNVLSARSGREAVELYKTRKGEISLVVLDIVMPEMSGREVFDRLRAVDPTVKVLLCSGYSIEREAEAMLDEGAAGFLQKPFNLKGLSESVRSILGPKTETRR